MRAGAAVVASLALLAPAVAGAQAPPGLVPVYPPGVSPDSPRPPPEASPPPARRQAPIYPPPGYGTPVVPQPYAQYLAANDTLPLTLPYEDGQTIPRGYSVESRVIRSYVVAGSVSFGAAYLSSVIAGGVTLPNKSFTPLFVPAIGPFVAVGTTASTGAGTVWLVLDGLAQTGGVVMFAYGLAAHEKYLQRESSGRATPLDVLTHPQVGVSGPGVTMRWTM